jgi:O-acetyl-ADP-ribose deacetylase (regulator of RNase III)
LKPERIVVVCGDITAERTVAIVNAANESLLGGGGVDGAIHRAAGRGLLAECRRLDGCPTGEARITAAYDLPCDYVIHTVGPVYADGSRGEPQLLASCYRSSLRLAVEHEIATIAFPSISTGSYGYPIEAASEIAMRSVWEFLADNAGIEQVRFVCFSAADQRVYEQTLVRLTPGCRAQLAPDSGPTTTS